MAPTLRCVLLFAFGFPVCLLAAVAAEELWVLGAGYLGAAVVVSGLDAVLGLARRRVFVEISHPETLFIGEKDPLVLEVVARDASQGVRMEYLVDLDPKFEAQPRKSLVLAEDGSARAEVPLVPVRRGTLTIDALWMRWSGPFGLIRRKFRIGIGANVAVVPNVRAVREAAIRFTSADEYLAGLKIIRFIGQGSEFESLREYEPGLDHRAIDWKASARHKKLLVQERRDERNHQVVIAIDSGHLMSEPMEGIPKLDHAINVGLMLGYLCVRTGDRVGLFGFDERVRIWTKPGSGMMAFRRLQRASADLEYSHVETNFTLGLAELSLRLRRRSLVVLLTDFVDTITAELMIEHLALISRRHLVVFVTLRDPTLERIMTRVPDDLDALQQAVIAGDFARERDVVLQRLQRMGILCLDAPPKAISVELLNRYLEIKRKGMI